MKKFLKKTKFIQAFKKLNYTFKETQLAALDLGCKDTLNLSFLFHFGGFRKLSAVDTKSIFHSDYKAQNKIISDDLSYIDDHSYTDVYEFFNSSDTSFDLIILSNFLHLFRKDEGKRILNKCFKLLKSDGIVYILIANEEHKGWENKFNKYKNPEEYEGPEWGMDIKELTAFIKPLKIIYSNQFKHHIEIVGKLESEV